MNPAASDHELLVAFARTSSQAAFAELVNRHLGLVYAAARRQVRSPEAAEEVCQSVFTDLARKARSFSSRQPLAPWLFVVSRRTAIDHIRRESRRIERERAAAAAVDMNPTPDHWAEFAAVLDAALADLAEADRAALVLRYFEDRSLREIGGLLGVSEDTAQKRVARALERLRGCFTARGVPVSSLALATQLAANAAAPVPAGLAATVTSAGVAAAIASATATSALQGIVHLVTRKTVTAVVVAATAGVLSLQAYRLTRQGDELAQVHREALAADAARDKARAARDATREELAAIRAELARRQPVPLDRELDAEVAAWFGRVTRLKQLAAESPQWTIPELRLLTERHWFDIARDAKFDTESDRRGLLQELRRSAKLMLGQKLQAALTAYLDANDGRLPTDVVQLAPFLDAPLEGEILARYAMRRSGVAYAVPRDEAVLEERAAVDPEHDTRMSVCRLIVLCTNLDAIPTWQMREGLQRFAQEHRGALPATADELLPYLPTSVGEQARTKLLAKSPADFHTESRKDAVYVE